LPGGAEGVALSEIGYVVAIEMLETDAKQAPGFLLSSTDQYLSSRTVLQGY
jgi:hypothetical protein